MSLTIQDLVTDAFRELGVLNAVDPPTGEDSTLGLFRLNKILDNFNADRDALYAQVFTSLTLSPGVNPHTIGPSGATVTVSQRPVSIEGAQLIVGANYSPIKVRDRDWYRARTNPSLQSAVVTDLFYEPSFPNGSIYFQPVPSSPYSVLLDVRVVLAAVTLADVFTFPPGYQDFLTMLLAIDLSAPMGVAVSPETRHELQVAMARVGRNNIRIPTISTRDAGMPRGRSGGSASSAQSTTWDTEVWD
jgi:hypothetical protein